jgi:DNA replication and repair protein RecF
MSLGQLSIQNLRCLRQVDLDLHPGRNLIIGANGSGKTSLLEAIFLLGRGRSFRTRNSERLITHGESRLVVFGRTLPPEEPAIPTALGIQVTRGEATLAKIQGAFTRTLADLSQALPVQVIDPGVHKLV